MLRLIFPICTLIAGCCACCRAVGPILDPIVRGTWTVEYLVLDPHEMLIPVTVETAGYQQTVQRIHRGFIVTVTSDVSFVAVNSRSVRPPSAPEDLARWAKIDPEILAADGDSDAVRAALCWLERSVPYIDNPTDPQDADSVLKRGNGNCVGRSEVLNQLLNSIGIASRTVRGCLYQNGDTCFHRWIEVDYPGIGSFPSEPGFTQDYVTPYHLIILPSAAVDPTTARLSEIGVELSIRQETRLIWTIDLKPVPDSIRSISRRQISARRHSTAIVGHLSDAPDQGIEIDLVTGGTKTTAILNSNGCFSFIPVRAGPFRLSVRDTGQGEIHTQEGNVREGELVHLNFNLSKRKPLGRRIGQ